MSRDILQNIIEDFTTDKFIRFFRAKNRAFAPRQEKLEQYNDSTFKNSLKLGEINFSREEQMIICALKSSKDLSEKSGKREQYEKGKKILKDSQSDAGIFVFYDEKKDFRFSLIYTNYLGKRRDWSNYRRFTYFVSDEFTNKTFLQRIGGGDFSSLEKIKEAFSVEKVTKTFYTDIANWYFWAVQKSNFPKDVEDEDNGRNIAVIRMITRLIFIWFMKERKLIPPTLFDYNQLVNLLKEIKPETSTYYKAILQNLFFATLNTSIKARKFRFENSFQGKNKDYMNHSIYRYADYFKNKKDMLFIFKDIPFLNGGLFDCLDRRITEHGKNKEIRIDGFTDKNVGLNIPNYLFFSGEKTADLNKEYGTKNKKYKVRGLIDILSSYNFTIDENDPNDQEVALDPELLGKVFENLLASFNPETASTARKATGSYYTPREVVDYMVVESLKEYLRAHLKDINNLDDKLDMLFSLENDKNPFNASDTKKIITLIDRLRIVDPAVGSGAFPMGILNKLVFILSKLDPANTLWEEAQINGVESSITDPVLKKKLKQQIMEQFAEKNLDYGRKLYLIQKCVYGVDIQQIAVEIAKLRFFISLLVDEKIDKTKENWGLEPLPNLDFKIIQGNSLISEFMGIKFDVKESQVIGDEIDDLIKIFHHKKNEFQNEPEKCKKDKIKQDIENLIIKIFENKLKKQKSDYFRRIRAIEQKYSALPNAEQREKIIDTEKQAIYKKAGFDLGVTEKRLREFTSGQKTKPFFLWNLYFSEVFKEKKGFDIVIANPPYVGEKGHKEMFREIKKGSLGKFYQGKMDLFYFFFHLALNLGNQYSNTAFITTNYYSTATGAKNLRQDFKERSSILQLINFNELKIFESALGQHNMITMLKKGQDEKATAKTCITSRQGFATHEMLQQILSGNDNKTTYWKIMQNDLYDGDEYYIRLAGISGVSDNPIHVILEKIKKQGLVLPAMCDVNTGIMGGCDYISKKNINYCSSQERIKKDINIGDGVFILDDTAERDKKAIKNIKSSGYLYEFYKNSDIGRYYTNNETSRYIIFSSKTNGAYKNLAIKKHLDKFKCVLVKNREINNENIKLFPFLRRGTAHQYIFESPKIVAPQRSSLNTFGYNEIPWYASADVYFITEKDKSISLKYILALLNSKLYYLWLYHRGKRKGESLELYQKPLSEIPIKKIPEDDQKPFIDGVDKILAITKDDDYLKSATKQAKVKEYEKQIDQMVYKLYGLTKEEIKIVEGSR